MVCTPCLLSSVTLSTPIYFIPSFLYPLLYYFICSNFTLIYSALDRILIGVNLNWILFGDDSNWILISDYFGYWDWRCHVFLKIMQWSWSFTFMRVWKYLYFLSIRAILTQYLSNKGIDFYPTQTPVSSKSTDRP